MSDEQEFKLKSVGDNPTLPQRIAKWFKSYLLEQEDDSDRSEQTGEVWIEDPEIALDLINGIEWGDSDVEIRLLRKLSLVASGNGKFKIDYSELLDRAMRRSTEVRHER